MSVKCLTLCFIVCLLLSYVSCYWEFENEDYTVNDEEGDNIPDDFYDERNLIFTVSTPAEEEGNVKIPNESEPKADVDTGFVDPDKFPDSGTEARSFLGELPEKVDKLLSNFKAQEGKITELEQMYKKLVLKINAIEEEMKTNSVILTNVREDQHESTKKILQKALYVFNKIMKVRVTSSDIASALRARGPVSENGNNPIVVKFLNFPTKVNLLRSSHRLSSTNIKISSAYSELVEQTRAALVPYLERARAKGNQAYLYYDRLVVNGVYHTLEELQAQDEYERNNPDEQVEELVVLPL